MDLTVDRGSKQVMYLNYQSPEILKNTYWHTKKKRAKSNGNLILQLCEHMWPKYQVEEALNITKGGKKMVTLYGIQMWEIRKVHSTAIVHTTLFGALIDGGQTWHQTM